MRSRCSRSIGIVYGALVALVQKDFKFVIGYSSVSHMGFVLLGLVTLNQIGLSGAVLQMFSHGIIAGLLFAVVGRMVYDRTHTRDLTALQSMGLARALPFAAVTFVLASVASMGLPGFSGFVAELQVLAGAWRAFPGLAILAGSGWWWESRIRCGCCRKPSLVNRTVPRRITVLVHLSPITLAERLGAVLLLGTSLVIGLYPRLLLDLIVPSFNTALFDGMRKAGML